MLSRHLRGARPAARRGKILVLFVVLLPALLMLVVLVLDGSKLLSEFRHTQHVADAAAVAAARQEFLEEPPEADYVARQYVQQHNGLTRADVTVNIPPRQGAYEGADDYVEVTVSQPVDTILMGLLGGQRAHRVVPRAVGGFEPSTARAAIVALDPEPPPLSISPLPGILPPLPAVLSGLELLEAGRLEVDGAVLVNTTWGGVDEDGNPAGSVAPPPFAVSCDAGLTVQKLFARDIRVVGGVDNPNNYGHIDPAQSSPLEANKLPVRDPLRGLPPPTVATDPDNVDSTDRGGVRVAGLPVGRRTRLRPGVYDWIEIVSGRVVFEPGVYIIRGVNPVTQISLNVAAADVRARGVMFYLTNSDSYSALTGAPDASDGETPPPPPGAGSLVPSAAIDVGLESRFSPLDDGDSPFDGMLIYQRRKDRRPIVIVDQGGGRSLQGTIYAKWGHATLLAAGTSRASFAVGTMRVVNLLAARIDPRRLFPPAQDVYLVE